MIATIQQPYCSERKQTKDEAQQVHPDGFRERTFVHSWLTFAFLFFYIFCTIPAAYTQAQLGLVLDNYAGINSSLLNPALPATSPFIWDVNLIAFHGYFDNSYAFFEEASLFDMRRTQDMQHRPDLSNEPGNLPKHPLVLDYFTDRQAKWASGLVSIMGPSAMLRLEDSGLAFALSTQFRMNGQLRKIPTVLDYYPYDATPRYRTIAATPFKGAFMTWGELGLGLSKNTETYSGSFAWGATLKILAGMEAAFGELQEDFRLTKRGTDTLHLQNVRARFGFTTSNADYYNNETPNPAINGYGLGLDLGVLWQVEGEPEKYQWRAGIAIVDIGRIAFAKNAHSYRIHSDAFDVVYSKYETLTNPVDVAAVLSHAALGDSSLALVQKSFTVWLPAALQIHGDYAFSDRWYLGAALRQRLPFAKIQVDRDNVLAIAPRFEHRWLGIALPLQFVNYQKLRLGFSARLGLLIIGSDNLLSLFKQKRFTGSDLYLALKLNPFQLKNSHTKRGGQVKCYNF